MKTFWSRQTSQKQNGEILPVTDRTAPWLWSTSCTQVSQYPAQPCHSLHLSEILCHHLWVRITVNLPVISQEPWRKASLFYTSYFKTLATTWDFLGNAGSHKSWGGFPTARGDNGWCDRNKTGMQQWEGDVYWFPSSTKSFRMSQSDLWLHKWESTNGSKP